MLPGKGIAGSGRAVRAILALTAVTASLGAAVSLARSGGGPSLESRVPVAAPKNATAVPASEALPARPLFIEEPDATEVAEVQFRFHVPPKTERPQADAPAQAPAAAKPRRRFECRFDGGDWRGCTSPLRLGAVPTGAHGLAVRALTRSGRAGAVAFHSWQQVDPKPIAIASNPIEDLYPGFPPQPLAVTVTNPNDVPVEVTRLTVDLAADPPNCPAENFRLRPSTASPGSPLPVPAGESVTLPSGTISAPAIEMLDLAVNQDACRGARVDLVFTAEAHG